jgi:hypothetical protein
MSELEKLMRELQNMKQLQKSVPNNSDTWSKIANKDWDSLGMTEEEVKQWISENPYANI